MENLTRDAVINEIRKNLPEMEPSLAQSWEKAVHEQIGPGTATAMAQANANLRRDAALIQEKAAIMTAQEKREAERKTTGLGVSPYALGESEFQEAERKKTTGPVEIPKSPAAIAAEARALVLDFQAANTIHLDAIDTKLLMDYNNQMAAAQSEQRGAMKLLIARNSSEAVRNLNAQQIPINWQLSEDCTKIIPAPQALPSGGIAPGPESTPKS